MFQRLLSIVYTTLSTQSQFGYFNNGSGNCGKSLFDGLQKLENRAARVRTFSRYDADANRLFRQLNWLEHSVSNTKSLNGLQ